MPWSWISAPLMCSDSLPCSCCVYIALGFVNVAEGWAPSTIYQHVCGSVSACSHQSPLRHELRSDCHLCLSTRPNAIGCELPVASPTCPPSAFPHPFACVNYVSAWGRLVEEGRGGAVSGGDGTVVASQYTRVGSTADSQPAWNSLAGVGCPTPVSCTECIFNRGFHRSLARRGEEG